MFTQVIHFAYAHKRKLAITCALLTLGIEVSILVISALPRETTNVTQENNYSQAVIFSLGNPLGCMQLIGFNEETSVPYDDCYCYYYKNGNIEGPPACNVTCPAPHSNIYLFPLLVNSLWVPPPDVTPEFLAIIPTSQQTANVTFGEPDLLDTELSQLCSNVMEFGLSLGNAGYGILIQKVVSGKGSALNPLLYVRQLFLPGQLNVYGLNFEPALVISSETPPTLWSIGQLVFACCGILLALLEALAEMKEHCKNKEKRS